ncbi:AMP-binding protein [Pseudonocardia sp. NPDC049154]|uniref:AMP-binding protein n=1 Tax=Pseudonocardia sp. NPDC049154 TaxID=3155501 RepID=UPI003404896A
MTTEPTDPWWYVPEHTKVRYDERCHSIPNTLRQTAARLPDAEALVAEDGRRTFAELEGDMLASVRAVRALGVRPGDRVALWAPNCGRWIVAALGVLGAGAVLVPVNTRFKGEEAAYVLRHSGATALLTVDGFLGVDYPRMLREADPELAVLAPGRTVLLSGQADDTQLSWADFLASGASVPLAEAEAALDAVGPDDLSDIMFTSGTTGYPKGVQLTHRQSLRAYGHYSLLMDFRPGDRYLIIPPFFHTFGYKAGWLSCLIHGTTIIPTATFDVADALRTIDRERVSILFGPPTIFHEILDSPERASFDLTSLRMTMISAATVPPSLAQRVARELKPEAMHGGYGLTEASSYSTYVVPTDDFEAVTTTVGRPSWGVEAKIVDEQGREVGTGVEGELLLRGFNITAGYWDEPERTAEVIDADGWLRTGDVVTRDERGYIRVTDRKKDMIIVGGFNVYPAEVERILVAHPKVAAIAVVGAPDPRMGEAPVAFVVPHPGFDAAEFRAWAKEHIANFKVPSRVEVVAQLPRNASMKVLKNELRARLAEPVAP